MVVSYKHIDEMKPWSDKLHLLECISVTPETPDVMTFLFRSEDQNWFRYLPGQFVTLELPVGREPLYRTYTLSSSPSRPYALSVTVKAQANSIGTRWMFDNLKPGMKIRALGPLGDFSYVKHPGDKYLFISAGSGVTPMMSMVRDMSDRAPQSDIAFINCSRTPGDIVFRHELEYLARFMPNLSLGFIVEKCGRTDLWSGLKGMSTRPRSHCSRMISWSAPSSAAGRSLSWLPSAPCWMRQASTWAVTIRKASRLPPPSPSVRASLPMRMAKRSRWWASPFREKKCRASPARRFS